MYGWFHLSSFNNDDDGEGLNGLAYPLLSSRLKKASLF